MGRFLGRVPYPVLTRSEYWIRSQHADRSSTAPRDGHETHRRRGDEVAEASRHRGNLTITKDGTAYLHLGENYALSHAGVEPSVVGGQQGRQLRQRAG